MEHGVTTTRRHRREGHVTIRLLRAGEWFPRRSLADKVRASEVDEVVLWGSRLPILIRPRLLTQWLEQAIGARLCLPDIRIVDSVQLHLSDLVVATPAFMPLSAHLLCCWSRACCRGQAPQAALSVVLGPRGPTDPPPRKRCSTSPFASRWDTKHVNSIAETTFQRGLLLSILSKAT